MRMVNTKLWLVGRQLRSKSPQRRLRAVQKLRGSSRARAAELLRHAFADADAAVRAEAVAALGELEEESALETLIAALHDPAAEVQEAAVHALKRLGGVAAIEALASSLNQDGTAVQWRAARALQALGWSPRTPAEELQFFIATGQLRRVGRFGTAAIGPLSTVLKEGPYEQRVAAATTLAEIADPAVIKPLLGALKDSDALVRTAAVNALTRVGDPEAVSAVTAALKDQERNVRVAATACLGQLGDPQSVEPLMAMLKDAEWEVRATALEALGRLGDPRAFQSVAARLDDGDEEVRLHAAEACAQVGDESVVEKLVLTMLDEHSGVRQAAARALNKLDPLWDRSERVQCLLPNLQAATRHKDASVQYAAATLLRRVTGGAPIQSPDTARRTEARREPQQVLRILTDLLRDPDALVRLAAAEALGRKPAPGAAEALQGALADADAWVQGAARKSLHALAGAAR